MSKYKLIVVGNSALGSNHNATLKENTKYRLLTYKEALEKAKERGGESVMYGYDDSLYHNTKGDNKYIYLKQDSKGYYRPKHKVYGIHVSVDMVELYKPNIKYNKELL